MCGSPNNSPTTRRPFGLSTLGHWASSATYALAAAVIAAGIVAEPMLDALRTALLLPG